MATSTEDYQKKLEFERSIFWRTTEPRLKRERDRSLTGKARIRARRALNKQNKLAEFLWSEQKKEEN